MSPRSLGCARCGACCDPVFLRPEAARVVDGLDATQDTATVEFASKHWQKRSERYTDDWAAYDCDMFNRESRLCTAGEHRPPVCRYFPWYHDGPTPERASGMGAYPQCSYLLDVPPVHRPEGARPLIPIEVISCRTVPVESDHPLAHVPDGRPHGRPDSRRVLPAETHRTAS